VRKIVAVVAAGACIVPALAFAASDPKPNSAFRWCERENRCSFSFETSRTGRKIKDITAYNRCAQVPVEGGYPKIPVEDGKFNKSGTVRDAIGQELDFTIKGRFKKPKKAVGTYEIDRRGCNSEPTEFVAKRVGPAQ
jgi:hypothetical protein